MRYFENKHDSFHELYLVNQIGFICYKLDNATYFKHRNITKGFTYRWCIENHNGATREITKDELRLILIKHL